MKITKTIEKEFVRHLLETNDKAIRKALLRIYDFQTQDEKYSQSTNKYNDVGFSGCDAQILSSFAEQIQKGWKLSPKQMGILRTKMKKYWKQILSISDIPQLHRMIEKSMSYGTDK